ncbi:lipoprotein [Spiroplasma endosymbiont of Atherix ibis]|uniref:lipoprotein n=1 Tax=Spiroplasma endosymbiont of Atherix ibis TaxID=3066291 RepID=UPI0030CCF1D0
MKKLFSILGAFAIVSTSISDVVSCSVATTSIETLVDGNNKFTIGGKKVEMEKVFGSKRVLTILGYQILDAISFTESKYQNHDKLEKQKNVLGAKGQALSLDNLKKEDSNSFGIEFIKGKDIEEFKNDYNSPVDSRFSQLNFKLGINHEIKESEIWTSNNATTFTANKAKVLKAKLNYDNNKVESIEKVNEEKSLQDYFSLTWEKKLNDKDLKEKYKKYGFYLLTNDQANSLYDEISRSNNQDDKDKLIKHLSKEEFRILHTQLRTKEEALRNGIVMPGKFENNFKNKDETKLENFTKGQIHDISKGSYFFRTEDKKTLQSQVIGGSNNSERTFIYGKSDSNITLEIDFTFDIPASKRDGTVDRKYNINLKLKNIVVSYQLNAVVLDKEKEENKKRNDEVIYWYQPVFYQFTTQEMFKINSSTKNNDGTKDIFKDLEGATINITRKQ